MIPPNPIHLLQEEHSLGVCNESNVYCPPQAYTPSPVVIRVFSLFSYGCLSAKWGVCHWYRIFTNSREASVQNQNGAFVQLPNLLVKNLKGQEEEPQTYLDGKLLASAAKKRAQRLTDIIKISG